MTIEQITAERDRLRAIVQKLADWEENPDKFGGDLANIAQEGREALANTSPAPVEGVNKELLDAAKDVIRGDQFSDMAIILERCGHPQLAKFWRDYRARMVVAIAKAEKD